MKTTTKQINGGHSIRGAKIWIANAPIADVFVVWAMSKADGSMIGSFILGKGEKGPSAPKFGGKHSRRATATDEIVIAGLKASKDGRLPDVKDLKDSIGPLNRARHGVSWHVSGAPEA